MFSLLQDDRKVPQISQILPMLQRGIGVHHSGLLPIVKEVIEIMFQEGLLKVLFATGENSQITILLMMLDDPLLGGSCLACLLLHDCSYA